MKNLFLTFCLAVGCVCGGTELHVAPLSGDQLEPGDAMLVKSVPGKYELYHLWPGDGRRDDDPLKGMTETFERRIKNVTSPSIMVMKPDKPNGKAVLVFPGGGYGHLAAKKEGSLVGQWLNKQGITAFVVKYRVPKRKGVNAPLQDAQRAIRFVRGKATQFGINPEKVGVMGFSAGGHLCATTVHQFDVASYLQVDALDKLDCKPNFCILIYPAYLKKGAAAELSKIKDPSIPIYITISQKDNFIAGVEAYIPILKEAKVDYSYHAYPSGGHGTGLGGFPWIETCEKWLSLKIKSD
ncbi:MAG: acetyl esterase/lipase [Crocinitomicaceae bacterium]|jgi:acetyl esterase/lipase